MGWIRGDAARALSKMGAHATPHVNVLRAQFSKEEDQFVRSTLKDANELIESS